MLFSSSFAYLSVLPTKEKHFTYLEKNFTYIRMENKFLWTKVFG